MVNDFLSNQQAGSAGAADPKAGSRRAGSEVDIPFADSVADAIAAAGGVAYRWTLDTDVLEWSEGAHPVLGMAEEDLPVRGRLYAALISPECDEGRFDAVDAVRALGRRDRDGIPFHATYSLGTDAEGARRWIEDAGRWFDADDATGEVVLGVVRCIDERRRAEERLLHLARFDPLTGFLNRNGLVHAVEKAFAADSDTAESCAFLLAGIDRLAMLNEAYGFDIADDLIAQVSQRLKQALRGADVIGRYSGNKIGMIIHDADAASMNRTGQRLLEAVQSSAATTSAGQIPVTVSIGGVLVPDHVGSAREAMMRAEEALSTARSRPVGSFHAFDSKLAPQTARRRNIAVADEIVAALNENRFAIAYQPIVDAATGRSTMHECLLRLIRPGGEIVAAGAFMETAEKLGLARMLDMRALDLALGALVRDPEQRLTINISALTAMSPEWLEHLQDAARRDPGVVSRLVIEITETVAIDDIDASMRFVEAVRDLGCRVAIDDFGAGYTSFRNLKMLDIDLVKIDGSFIENLTRNQNDQLFVKALVDLAHNFDLSIVAEWVTSQPDADLLSDWGVDFFQGHLMGAASMEPPWRVNWATEQDGPRRSVA